jgi:hypothetical protein
VAVKKWKVKRHIFFIFTEYEDAMIDTVNKRGQTVRQEKEIKQIHLLISKIKCFHIILVTGKNLVVQENRNTCISNNVHRTCTADILEKNCHCMISDTVIQYLLSLNAAPTQNQDT